MERTEHFGNNFRPPLKAKSLCKMFFQTLDDIMLKVLLVCASFSIIFDTVLADPKDRSHGKFYRVAKSAASFFRVLNYYIAWVEGFAIFVAVFTVSGVGTGVDYRKEQSFVASRLASD